MSLQSTNRLLDALPLQERTALHPYFERVAIPARAVLFRPDQAPRYAYLLTSGVASVVSQMTGGNSVEVSLIGREGMPGSCRLLHPSFGHTRCVMQEAGTGYRMEFRRFEQAFHEMPGLHKRILQHVQHECFMMEQLSACNRVHSAEQRVARWLLMAADRAGDLLLSMTQESLSDLLGTRRTTITLVAGIMQRKGLIRYRRGRLQVLDHAGLEALSCECFGVTRKALNNLYAEHDMPPASAPAPVPPFERPVRSPFAGSLTPRFA